MGGEPFLHPDLSLIIKTLLKYDNFGFISIATNGVFPIKLQQMDGLNDPRVIVSFNNYLNALPPQIAETFNNNIIMVKKNNIHYTVGTYMKEWAIPSTLYDNNVTTRTMIERKEKCTNSVKYLRCHQLKDGKLHLCDFANSVHNIGLADYPTDYVDITSIINLRERLYKNIHAPYYRVCGHCRFNLGSTIGAVIQGRTDYINTPSNIDRLKYIPQ
jgi:MoaA/NifB/PqqE/SkfB family radical SAM enzyme